MTPRDAKIFVIITEQTKWFRLFHVFLVEIHQDGADGVTSSVWLGNRHVGIDFVLRSVRGEVSIGEAY